MIESTIHTGANLIARNVHTIAAMRRQYDLEAALEMAEQLVRDCHTLTNQARQLVDELHPETAALVAGIPE